MKVMITGCSRGIGQALAKELVKQGHTVWGISRSEVGENGRIMESKRAFIHTHCDVSCELSRQKTAAQMAEAQFVPDVVILNAAIEYEEPLASLSWPAMRAVFQTNVDGALYWVSHWLDQSPCASMQFIAISTLMAYWPDSNCPAYCASKAALSMAFRALRFRYAKASALFKIVYLGPVHTGINPRFRERKETGRWIVSPSSVACLIANRVLYRKCFSFYYPWPVYVLCRMFGWLSDGVFEWLTRPLRR